jgi:hypothetical protein
MRSIDGTVNLSQAGPCSCRPCLKVQMTCAREWRCSLLLSPACLLRRLHPLLFHPIILGRKCYAVVMKNGLITVDHQTPVPAPIAAADPVTLRSHEEPAGGQA